MSALLVVFQTLHLVILEIEDRSVCVSSPVNYHHTLPPVAKSAVTGHC